MGTIALLSSTFNHLTVVNLLHNRTTGSLVIFFRLEHSVMYIITASKRSLGQGNIFTPVCQSFCSHGEGVPWQVPTPGPGTPPGTRYTPLGPDTPPGTRYALQDQVHPWDQVHPPGQVHPPRAVHAGRYGQQAGGTHPTGMHSCSLGGHLLLRIISLFLNITATNKKYTFSTFV